MKTKNYTLSGRFPAASLTNSLAGVFIACALAIPATGSQVVHTYVPQQNSGLAPQGQLEPSQQFHLTVGLPVRDAAGLTTLLQTLYDPTSPNFRNWQTPEQLADQFGASPNDLQAISDWAAAHNLTVSKTHANHLIIELDGSVADVQKALNVTFNQYRDSALNRVVYAPDREPTIDLDVPVLTIDGLNSLAVARSHVHVQTDAQAAAAKAAREALKIPPLSESTTAGNPVPMGPTPQAGSGPGGNYAGCDFRAAYAPGVSLTGAGQSVGLLQFDNYYLADIIRYETNFGLPNVPIITVPITAADPPAPGGGNLETSLDIEMAIAMAPELSAVYVYETGNANNYTAMLSRMQTDNLSRQLSSSWDISFGTPQPPSGTVENIFQLMAAQGQSFFQASGDGDAWTNTGTTYFPWPMDSPNITLVGGTTLSTAGPCRARTGEVVWNWGGGTGSSGGISVYWGIPWWQVGTPVGAALGSTTLRNIPDVALTADQIVVDGGNGATYTGVGGTSCAAPLWAGFMALVNQRAMNEGRSPIGFLNPSVYALGKSGNYANSFNDVTTGNNFWGGSPTHFPAVAGYDLCTGWGTPKGQTLINLLAGPPAPIVTNGGFETGDMSYWVNSGSFISAATGAYAHSGTYGAAVGPSGGLGYLYQFLNNTVRGQQYVLSFWLQNFSGAGPSEFKVWWNGTILMDSVNPPAFGWTYYSFTVTANTSSPYVEFDVRNDPSYFGLDDIQLTPVIVPAPLEVNNGGFETGNFSSWTQGGNLGSSFVSGGTYARSGYYGAQMGPVTTLGTLSQSIPTIPGQSYLLSFWLENPSGGTGTEFRALWNGGVLMDTINGPAQGWTRYQFTVQASSATTPVEFDFRHDPTYWGFDDIFVAPVALGSEESGLTFEDIPDPGTGGAPVANGYGALNWNNFYALDGSDYGVPSGYLPGAVSPKNAGYNAFGAPASISSAVPFNLNSAYLTAAWNDGLNVEVRGFFHGEMTYDQTYVLSATAPSLINFNFMNVDTVTFNASGGTPHLAYGTNSATHFVIDNIVKTYPIAQFDAAYVRSTLGEPWGLTSPDTAMNMVFGTNQWADLRYQTANAGALFTPSTHFVYMEGGDNNWNDMFAFLNANRPLIETWVNNGGYLFINAAPNQSIGGLLAFNTILNYNTNAPPASNTGAAVDPTNPIFNGPFTPVGTSWTGGYFSHATVTGDGGLVPLITGSAGVNLAEVWPGLGHAVFGGITDPFFQSPQPQSYNLRANIIAYAAGARGTFGRQGTFDDLPGGGPVPNGYLGVNWNNINYGTAPANSGYSAGLISSPNIGFNANGTAANINSPNPFDLHSAYFTAAWNDNLQLHAQGFNRGTLIYDQTYTLQATMPTLINFDFLGVTEVDFTTSGGVHHAGYTGSGTHFALDNILISTGDAVASGIDHFVWNAIPSPECMGPLIPVTITAKDANNNTVTTFNGNVSFNGWDGVRTIDDFDTGVWPHAPWVASGAAFGASGAAYIHDGAAGFSDAGGVVNLPDWYYRTDVSIGTAGQEISWWVRPGTGRAYLGFAANAVGTWAVVAAPNFSTLIIQNDSPYGSFADVASVPQTWLPGKWYKVAVHFNSTTSVTANVYDSDGITLLNTLSYTGITGAPGGVAIRAFGGFSVDTLQRGTPVLAGVLPPVSGNFVNGVWSGSLQTPLPSASMIITATEGLRGQSGSSNPFTVSPLNLTVTKVVGGVNVCWNTCVGGHYQLQQKSGNILNPWANVGGVLTAGGAQLCVTVAEPPPPWNFFRVVVVP